MRIILMFFALSITSLSAQEKKIVIKEGTNTFKVVYYNEAGNILQQGFIKNKKLHGEWASFCLLYTSPSPRDLSTSPMPSSA